MFSRERGVALKANTSTITLGHLDFTHIQSAFHKCVFGAFTKLLPHHFFAKASGHLAACQAGRGVRQSIVSAHGVPLLRRAGTAHVALRQKSLVVVGHLRSPAEYNKHHPH